MDGRGNRRGAKEEVFRYFLTLRPSTLRPQTLHGRAEGLGFEDGEVGEVFSEITGIAGDEAAAVCGEGSDEKVGNGTPGKDSGTAGGYVKVPGTMGGFGGPGEQPFFEKSRRPSLKKRRFPHEEALDHGDVELARFHGRGFLNCCRTGYSESEHGRASWKPAVPAWGMVSLVNGGRRGNAGGRNERRTLSIATVGSLAAGDVAGFVDGRGGRASCGAGGGGFPAG